MRIRRGELRVLEAVCVVAVLLAATARAQGDAPPPPAVAPALPAEEPPTPEARYKRGTNFFEYGDCTSAVEVLGPLAQPGQLKDEAQQVEVHRMLGVCFYQLGRIADASRELSSLLYIDPDYTLDPFLTPPPVVELFEAQKAGIRQKLDEIKKAREREEREAPAAGILVERTTVIRESPFATIFMPFGLAQLANGDVGLGVVLGSAQAALLAANIGAYWWTVGISRPATGTPTPALFGAREVKTPGDTVLYTTLAYAGAAALVVGVGVYLGSVVQAWWFREDRRVVEDKEERRALTPEEMKQALRRLDE